MSNLPTREEMFARAVEQLNVAYKALGDAADWLRLDWTPLGSPLTDEQVGRLDRIFVEIENAKNAINRAKD